MLLLHHLINSPALTGVFVSLLSVIVAVISVTFQLSVFWSQELHVSLSVVAEK